MVFAVVKTGGKQYIVREGDVVTVEKLIGKEGEMLSFSDVFLVAEENGDTVSVGTPTVVGASVQGTIVEQGRGKKIVGIKYKPKVRYRKKFGHRQPYTKVKIGKIAK